MDDLRSLKSHQFNSTDQNTITVKIQKDEMPYYKIEANIIFSKCLQISEKSFKNGSNIISVYSTQNSNVTGTSSVDITFCNDEAFQMYNLKQLTYGKHVASSYMTKPSKYTNISHLKVKPKQKHVKILKNKENIFLKAIETIPKVHRPIFEPPCPWLEKRLYVDDLCDKETTWEDIAVGIRGNMVNLANDMCIFYTTQSHFICTLIKVEAYNLMRLLSLPQIQEYNARLSKKLLKNLFILINQNMDDSQITFQEMRDMSKDLVLNYYKYPSPRARSMKDFLRDEPRILYFSLFLQNEFIPGIIKGKIDSRFIRIERQFHCKFILRRNLAAFSTQHQQMIKESLMELYFDFNRGRFSLAIANLNHIIRRNETRLYKDVVCYQSMISYMTPDFFCCEEVKSLTEREYVMDDMSYQFIKLMHWLKSKRIFHYIF